MKYITWIDNHTRTWDLASFLGLLDLITILGDWGLCWRRAGEAGVLSAGEAGREGTVLVSEEVEAPDSQPSSPSCTAGMLSSEPYIDLPGYIH